jgi:hypothetical protein
MVEASILRADGVSAAPETDVSVYGMDTVFIEFLEDD